MLARFRAEEPHSAYFANGAKCASSTSMHARASLFAMNDSACWPMSESVLFVLRAACSPTGGAVEEDADLNFIGR
eukprot:6196692-Pleurochrysis_carterae.AAC.4